MATTTEVTPPPGTTAPPQPGPRPRGAAGAALREGRAAWMLALPFCLLFLVFTAWPVVQSLFMSFTDTKAKDLRDPVRGRHRRPRQLHQGFSDPIFRRAALNTAYFVVVGVPLTLVVALAAAVALDKGITRFRVGVPARLLHAGDHLDRRRGRRLAVPAPDGVRAHQHRARLGRHHRARTGSATRTGRCRR